MISREEAIQKLLQHPDLVVLHEIETYRTEFLIDLAFECPLFEEPKRASLHGLMTYAARLVGRYAAYPELRDGKYEKAVRDYLNWLLPDDLEKAS
jgi:hypothetical protein